MFLELGTSSFSPPIVRLIASNALANIGLLPEAVSILAAVWRDEQVEQCLRENAQFEYVKLTGSIPSDGGNGGSDAPVEATGQLLGDAGRYLRMGQFSEAIAACEKCLEIEPSNPRAWYMKGIACHKRGGGPDDLSSAHECFKQCTNLNPESKVAWRMRGVTTADQGDHSEAIESLDRALTGTPQDAGIWCIKARVFLGAGDAGCAGEAVDCALDLNPMAEECQLLKEEVRRTTQERGSQN